MGVASVLHEFCVRATWDSESDELSNENTPISLLWYWLVYSLWFWLGFMLVDSLVLFLSMLSVVSLLMYLVL